MPTILVVGATRGLGASIVKTYAADASNHVLATARSSDTPADSKYTSAPHRAAFFSTIKWFHILTYSLAAAENIAYIPGIDIATPEASSTLIHYLESHKITRLDVVIITAGYFATESLQEPSFSDQERMYRTCAIGPTILVTALANNASLLSSKSKIIFVSSESGSITLRHESEGGGNYGHHASKTALNMSAKLLSLDLKDRGVAVACVHPGFMRTEMTKGVGFDKFWDEGGAVTPDVAAKSLVEWVDTFDISKTGQYWAPRGPAYVSTLFIRFSLQTNSRSVI
jgi:NAD(P)-dependent dehydrogenase (short-subunit alcohol dehydrogenase family)